MERTAFLLMAFAVTSAANAASPQTRLYVKTQPPGATVLLNGKELGVSDGLFVVAPGRHTVRVVLTGYVPERRAVDVPAGRIVRVEVNLRRKARATSRPDAAAGKAARAYLQRAKLPKAVLAAMVTVLRQHPGETRWSGRQRSALFGIVAHRLPKGAAGKRATAALLNLTHMRAVQEMLKAKSLLDRYAKAALTDATTLRRAVSAAAGKLRVTGRVEGVRHAAALEGGYAVAYVLAEEAKLSAHLLLPAELEKVRRAYRDVMHDQARDLMRRKNFADALLLWRHLHQRKLVSQALYLDAARCLVALKQNDDAVRVLAEALAAFEKSAGADFFEQAGDIALAIDTPAAQKLAEKAYTKASDCLRETVTGPAEASP